MPPAAFRTECNLHLGDAAVIYHLLREAAFSLVAFWILPESDQRRVFESIAALNKTDRPSLLTVMLLGKSKGTQGYSCTNKSTTLPPRKTFMEIFESGLRESILSLIEVKS